jgi:hypothetical protein
LCSRPNTAESSICRSAWNANPCSTGKTVSSHPLDVASRLAATRTSAMNRSGRDLIEVRGLAGGQANLHQGLRAELAQAHEAAFQHRRGGAAQPDAALLDRHERKQCRVDEAAQLLGHEPEPLAHRATVGGRDEPVAPAVELAHRVRDGTVDAPGQEGECFRGNRLRLLDRELDHHLREVSIAVNHLVHREALQEQLVAVLRGGGADLRLEPERDGPEGRRGAPVLPISEVFQAKRLDDLSPGMSRCRAPRGRANAVPAARPRGPGTGRPARCDSNRGNRATWPPLSRRAQMRPGA